MKKKDVSVGGEYRAMVSGKLCRVRLEAVSHYGGWVARNLDTDRTVRIRSAQRLRPLVLPEIARAARATVPSAKKYRVLLSSVGNPDYGQFAPVSAPKAIDCNDLAECQLAAEQYIAVCNLGGG